MSTNYSPKTVTDNLIILFDAGNSKSYPGTGTSWFDLAGGNTGTFGGGSNPTYNSLGGGSILFDGANYYQTITCSDTISHRPNQSFSYEIWSYFNTFTGYDKILLGKPGCNVGLMEINGTMYMSVVGPNGPCQGGSTSAAATAAITAGVWTHWVGTYNVGTGVILYKNGQPVSTASFTGTLGDWGTTLYIGGDNGLAVYTNRCYVSTVKVYSKALNSLEVLQNYNSTKGRFGL